MPLRGDFAVPGVGLDGSSGGLSADGRTLVLTERRASIPRPHTAFPVPRADRLRLRRIVRLRGDFSYDALSPDGRRLYLIQYLSATDPTRYAVRLYDVRAGRLRPKPVVDPDEHAGEMRGEPLSRTYGPGGRWAYTLYDGNGKHPFVHALDTVAGAAGAPQAASGPLNRASWPFPVTGPRLDYERPFARSAEGRELVVSASGEPRIRRKVLVIGCIHGTECAGTAIADAVLHT